MTEKEPFPRHFYRPSNIHAFISPSHRIHPMQSLSRPPWQRCRLAASLTTTTTTTTTTATLLLLLCFLPSCFFNFAHAVDISSSSTWENESALTLAGQELGAGIGRSSPRPHTLDLDAYYYDDDDVLGSRDYGQERLSSSDEAYLLDYDRNNEDNDDMEDHDDDDDDEENHDNNARTVPRALTALGNNQFMQGEIKIGETHWWYFPKRDVNGNKTELKPKPASLPYENDTGGMSSCMSVSNGTGDGYSGDLAGGSVGGLPRVFLSLTTCSKPALNNTDAKQSAGNAAPDLPQLELHVSISESVKRPGPGSNSSEKQSGQSIEGFSCANVATDGNVYIGVSAPNTTAYTGSYKYQLAASIDTLFHSIVLDNPFLYFLDADVNAALLISENLTQADDNSDVYKTWMNSNPPYTIFANNVNDTAIAGLERSYCALSGNAQIGKGSKSIHAGMTARGLGKKPKEQFYLTGLNRSSTYYGILAMDGNSTQSGNGVIGGGGKVFKPMKFSTKADDNCAVLFDLDFCSEVAYAVPSRPSIDVTDLSAMYDNNSAALYQNFSYSLQQIQCNRTAFSASSMFSLAVDCDQCDKAYREWLCAVTIPRCYDFSSNLPYLQPRNAQQKFLNGSSIPSNDPLRQHPASNRSRNHLIDDKIKPGPYKEILPCADVCYSLVKTCPSKLQFKCPQGSLMNYSYGYRVHGDRNVTCNYLGAAYGLGAGSSIIHGHGGREQLLSVLYWLGLSWVVAWAFVM